MTENLLEPVSDLANLMVSWRRALTAQNKAPATIKLYAEGLTIFLRWCADTGTAAELTKPTVEHFLGDLLANGAEPATAHARHKALRRFSAWLTEEGELRADPLLSVKPPRLDAKVVQALTDDELRALIDACKGKEMIDKRDEAMVRLMAETGLRAGEVIALQVSDVDLDRGLVTVRKGKGGKGRVVAIRSQVIAAIDRYLRSRRAHRLADAGALWLGQGGRTFRYHAMDDALKRRAKKAGIARFHPHLLRNTAATRWLRAGGTEQGLMAVAGWTRRDMLDRYTGASAAERAAEEARRLDLDL